MVSLSSHITVFPVILLSVILSYTNKTHCVDVLGPALLQVYCHALEHHLTLMRYGTLLLHNNVNLNLSSTSIHFPLFLNNDTAIQLMNGFTKSPEKG